jgi:hypothetical protein
MPELTLDNLFKYAVPKLGVRDLFISCKCDNPYVEVTIYGANPVSREALSMDVDPAMAVYNAIVKVFEQEEENVNR